MSDGFSRIRLPLQTVQGQILVCWSMNFCKGLSPFCILQVMSRSAGNNALFHPKDDPKGVLFFLLNPTSGLLLGLYIPSPVCGSCDTNLSTLYFDQRNSPA